MSSGFAESSLYEHWVKVGANADFGQTPPDDYTPMRLTSAGLSPSVESTQSAEIDPNRKAPDSVRTNQQGEGDFGFELSNDTFDDMIRALMMQDAYTAASPGQGGTGMILYTATGILEGAISDFDATKVGDIIVLTVAQFGAEAGNYVVAELDPQGGGDGSNVRLGVTSVGAADPTGSGFDTPSNLQIGKTKIPVYVERSFSSDGVTPIYSEWYKELMISTMAVTITPGAIITGTFGHLGPYPTIVDTGTKQRTGTDQAATATIPLNGMDQVKQIMVSPMTGVAALTQNADYVARCSEVSWNFDNQLRPDQAVGALGLINTGLGIPLATGTLNLYLQNAQEADRLTSDEEFVMAIEIRDPTAPGQSMIFSFSECKYQTIGTPITGGNAPAFVNLTWNARGFSFSRGIA